MKKSCSLKESKSVKCNKSGFAVNESKGTEPKQSPNSNSNRFHADKKPKEPTRKGDQPTLQQEGNNCKIPAPTTNSDKHHRSSPRLAKSAPWNAAKWIENSFDVQKIDETPVKVHGNKEETEETARAPRKKPTDINSRKDACSDPGSGDTERKLTQAARFDLGWKEERNVERSNNLLASGKKGQFGLLDVLEDSAGNDKTNSSRSLSPNFVVGKKRITSCDKTSTDSPKKIRMEESIANDQSNNNEAPPGDSNLLKLELELEKRRRDALTVTRDVETIVAECESRARKWKETYSKYDCPTRWGTPIVRQSTEKWDGSYIPAKLLERYQKFLLSKNMTHPIFLPPGSQVNFHPNADSQAGSDFGSSDRLNVLNFKSDGENGTREMEDILQAQTDEAACPDSQASMTDNSGRMVLRNRNQYRPVVIEDEEDLSDEEDDWSNSQKTLKNKAVYRTPQKANAKNKKGTVLNNHQLISSMERCNLNRKNGIKGDDLLGNNSSLEDETDSKAAAFVETMVCPICSLRFPKQHIESHATECASKTYKD